MASLLSKSGAILLVLLGLITFSALHCDRDKSPVSSLSEDVGGITLDVVVPNLARQNRAVAKAAVTQGHLGISGEGMVPIDTLLKVQDGRIQARLDGIPVGLRTVSLTLQKSSDDTLVTLWEASTEVTIRRGEFARATLALQRVGDEKPQIVATEITRAEGRSDTPFSFQAVVEDLHDATDSLQVRWDFDGDETFEVKWTYEKETEHTYDTEGNYTVKLEVRDRSNLVNAKMQEVEVTPGNMPPVADAGADKSVEVGTIVQLDGSISSDADGDELSYDWMQSGGVEVSLSDSTVVRPTFTPIESGTYTFILVVNDGQVDSAPDEVRITVTQIPSPSGLSATGGIGQIEVSWQASTDEDLLGYNVYHSTQSDGEYVRLTGVDGRSFTTDQTTYIDSGLVTGQVFYYKVTVVTERGESERSAFVSARVLADEVAPAVPEDVVAVADEETSRITVSWDAPITDEDGGELTGLVRYVIFRSQDTSTGLVPIDTLSADQTQYVDSGLEPATTYFYAIGAAGESGNTGPRSEPVSATTPDEPLIFADANLEAAVREAISKPTGDILPADIAELTELDASERNIANLDGIEQLTALRTLNLFGNQLNNISALSGLTALTYLNLFNNQLSDISALSGLIALGQLSLAVNQLSDISALSGLTALHNLDLYGNQLSDISALSGLTALEQLFLSRNQLSDSDISALSGLTALQILDLRDNPLSDEANSTQIPALQARGVTVEF